MQACYCVPPILYRGVNIGFSLNKLVKIDKEQYTPKQQQPGMSNYTPKYSNQNTGAPTNALVDGGTSHLKRVWWN